MENFSARIISLMFVCLVLFAVAWGLGWEMVAETSYPATHCDVQIGHVSCTPIGKAA